jgi:hypothetical protein
MQKPLEVFATLIVKEYCRLRNYQQAQEPEGDASAAATGSYSTPTPISMCSFFDNVKSHLFKKWERDIIKRSAHFTQ